ncbi:MotA/TolQ/ExbB proton channel family protein [uncultured Treponema sp.]|uniref:MotA/TolQ/ExbB proton channel family protein n=1 Tax=uncultured Treponema sp. TaxID=162155 RepID=UPI000E884E5D|nr:MotA/TolQ/ExbB proton channel family protein [uncultured Treponema sp.]HAZ96189.1 MotA/TolQ/ExbB proton channel family protein [Treponema sp.]
MFEILKSGGIVMVPIIACGLAAVFIIVERFHYFFSIKRRDEKLSRDIENCILKNDFQIAESVCTLADTPCAKIVKNAIEHRKFAERDLKEFIQSKMDLAVPEFEHNLSALSTISNVSTLLGLLGTVTGNIKAFGVLGNGGTMGDPALLAGAIAEALVTTVAGLVVAIPAIVFTSYFNSQVNHSIAQMEQTVTSVLFRLTKKGEA